MNTKFIDVAIKQEQTAINPDEDPEQEELTSTHQSRTVSIRQSTFRSWADRYFGSLAKGSMRGSIFALCSGAIGTGVLSLPYVLKINGWIIGTLLIFVGALGKTIILIS